jgi:hypothetical protein
MKTTNRVLLSGVAVATALSINLTPLSAYALVGDWDGTDTSDLVMTGDVKLIGDVALGGGQTLSIATGVTAVLDMNDHTITKTGNNYAITVGNNHATYNADLTIKDGTITCDSTTASCIENSGTMTLDNVEVESVYTAVKNEEISKMTINNSTITANTGGGAILNYSEMDINNSTITNEKEGGKGIWALTYQSYPSTTTLNNSVINVNGGFAVDETCEAVKGDTGCNVSGTYYKGEALVVVNGGSISNSATFNTEWINPLSTYSTPETKITGSVSAPITALAYAQSGATITLNGNVNGGSYTVPAGVVLVVPDNISFTEVNLVNNGKVFTASGKELVHNPDGTFSVAKIITGGNGSAEPAELSAPYTGLIQNSHPTVITAIASLIAILSASTATALLVRKNN